jgi:hypothetical protein
MHSLTGTRLKIGATANTRDAHDHPGSLAPDPYLLITHQGEQRLVVSNLEYEPARQRIVQVGCQR